MPEEIRKVFFEGTSEFGRKLVVGLDEHGGFVMKMTFEGAESKGTVIMSECAYGVGLDVEGIPGSVGSVDLFHPAVGDGGPMFIVDNCDDGDAVAFARLSLAGTRIDFESGVEEVGQNDSGKPIFGYPAQG